MRGRTVGQEPLEDGRVDSGWLSRRPSGRLVGLGSPDGERCVGDGPFRGDAAGVCDDETVKGCDCGDGGVDGQSWSGEGIEPSGVAGWWFVDGGGSDSSQWCEGSASDVWYASRK